MPPINGSIENYDNSSLGAMANFSCDEGFIPIISILTVCTSDGEWNPNPEQHICIMDGKI